MTTVHQVTTADELLRMPDDGFRYELVNGELHQMTPPGFEHGSLALELAISLGYYIRTHNLGRMATEIGFQLSKNPDTVRAPDGAFVTRARIEALGIPKGYWPGAPDLAIEIISPNDLYTEVDEKVTMWLDAGTRMVIVVNPRTKTVKVHRPAAAVQTLSEPDTLDGAEVVPGWTLPVRDIFA